MKRIKLFGALLAVLTLMLAVVPSNIAMASAPTPTSVIDYMSKQGSDIFDPVEKATQPIFSGLYGLLLTLGIGLLAIAGLVAVVCYGVLKDSSKIKENKEWLGRVLIAVIGAGALLSIIGIVSRIRVF